MNGNDILKCHEVVEKCSAEVDAMFTVLDQLVADNFSRTTFGETVCRLTEGKPFEWKYAPSQVLSDFARSYPLKRGGKGINKPTAYLCFQVSMFGEGTKIPKIEFPEPMLHISLWSAPIDDESYVGFPLDYRPTVEDGRLLTWAVENGSGWFTKEWTYSLRLVKLNNSSDLYKWVIHPAVALMKGLAAAEALPGGPSSDQIWVAYPNAKCLSEISKDTASDGSDQEECGQ